MIKSQDFARFANNMVFPVISYGSFFLFGFEFIYTLIKKGSVSESLEKELIGIIGSFVGYYIAHATQNRQNKDKG
jgi:hypothetical protein